MELELNVKRTMNILNKAIVLVNEYTHNNLFSDNDEGECDETLDKDLKNILGMTDEEIEIYKNRNKIDKNLVIPITFIDDFENDDINDDIDEEEDDI